MRFIIFYLNQLKKVGWLNFQSLAEIKYFRDGRLVSANLNHGNIGSVDIAFMRQILLAKTLFDTYSFNGFSDNPFNDVGRFTQGK
jgi:hypothetical protein